MYGSLLSLFKQAPMDPREMWKLQHPGCDLQRNRLDCLRQLYATPGYLPTYPPTPEIGFWPMLCMCLCTIGFTTLIALVFWDMYGEYVIKGYGMAQAASKYCKGYRKAQSVASNEFEDVEITSQSTCTLDMKHSAGKFYSYYSPRVITKWIISNELSTSSAAYDSGSESAFSSGSNISSLGEDFFADSLSIFTEPTIDPIYEEVDTLKEERQNLFVCLAVSVQERIKLQSQVRTLEKRNDNLKVSLEDFTTRSAITSEQQSTRIGKLIAALDEKNNEVIELQSSNFTLGEQLVGLTSQITMLSSKVTEASIQRAQALSTISELEAAAIADKEAAELSASSAQDNADIQQARITELLAQSEEYTVTIAASQSLVDSLKSRITELLARSEQDALAMIELKAASESLAASQQAHITELVTQSEQDALTIDEVKAASQTLTTVYEQQKTAQDTHVEQLNAQLAKAQVDIRQERTAAKKQEQQAVKEARTEAEKLAKKAAEEAHAFDMERCKKATDLCHKFYAPVLPFDLVKALVPEADHFDLSLPIPDSSSPLLDPAQLADRQHRLNRLLVKKIAPQCHPDKHPDAMKDITNEITIFVNAAGELYKADFDLRINTLKASPTYRDELHTIYKDYSAADTTDDKNKEILNNAVYATRRKFDKEAIEEYIRAKLNYESRICDRVQASTSPLILEFQKLYPRYGWTPDLFTFKTLSDKWAGEMDLDE